MTDYASAQACDLDAHARLVPRAAGPRRLPAALAVRGVVPVPAHTRRRTSTARSRPRRRRSVTLAERSGRGRPPTEGDAPFSADAAVREASRPPRRRPGAAHGRSQTWRCWRATTCTPSAWPTWPSAGTSPGVRRLAAIIARCAQAHAEGQPALVAGQTARRSSTTAASRVRRSWPTQAIRSWCGSSTPFPTRRTCTPTAFTSRHRATPTTSCSTSPRARRSTSSSTSRATMPRA